MRRPRRQGHPRHPGRVDDLLEGGAVLPVPIMDEVLPGREEAPLLHRHVACDLYHPLLVGVWRHPCHMHLPALQMDEKEDVIGHQPTPSPDLGRKKVRGDQYVHVHTNKLLPRGRRLALWGGGEAMPLEDVPHGLVAEGVAQVGKGSHTAIVAPGGNVSKVALCLSDVATITSDAGDRIALGFVAGTGSASGNAGDA